MLTQQKTPIVIKLQKQLCFSFLLSTIMFCSLYFFSFNKASAQILSPELQACYETAQARYACFMKQREGALERAKARETLRRSIQEAKEELRTELFNRSKKLRENDRKEIMKQVEISRSRNISHKGEKYSLNFGFVIEVEP
ncbi:MAG: hypothetical protein MAG581_00451 [Deltaproteobacteria bacterium]|jgi:Na+-translocating ferredoxin:NAD+ oxidoreductase RnfC subunit|nr:hypothetical protein [Deltaproteobacteria bacterium]